MDGNRGKAKPIRKAYRREFISPKSTKEKLSNSESNDVRNGELEETSPNRKRQYRLTHRESPNDSSTHTLPPQSVQRTYKSPQPRCFNVPPSNEMSHSLKENNGKLNVADGSSDTTGSTNVPSTKETNFGNSLSIGGNAVVHPLHLICRQGRFSVLANVLEANYNPNDLDYYGESALIALVNCDPVEAYDEAYLELCIIKKMETLIDYGADINIQSKKGSPLHIAIKRDYERVVEFLVKIGIRIDSPNDEYMTPLHIAARHGNLEIVQTLVQGGANVLAFDMDGEMPIYYAARYGHTEIAKFLVLDARSEINIYNNSLRTPLCYAVIENNPDMVDCLISIGAKVSMVNDALQDAILQNSTQALIAILKYEVDINFVCLNKYTFFWKAVDRQVPVDIMRILLNKSPNVDAAAPNGITPLMLAVLHDQVDLILACLGLGADVNKTDKLGRTAVYMMIERLHNVVHAVETPLENPATREFMLVMSRVFTYVMLEGGGDLNAITYDKPLWLTLCSIHAASAPIFEYSLKYFIDSMSDMDRVA